MANTAGRIRLTNLKELLPLAFRLPPGKAAKPSPTEKKT